MLRDIRRPLCPLQTDLQSMLKTQLYPTYAQPELRRWISLARLAEDVNESVTVKVTLVTACYENTSTVRVKKGNYLV